MIMKLRINFDIELNDEKPLVATLDHMVEEMNKAYRAAKHLLEQNPEVRNVTATMQNVTEYPDE